MTPSFSKSTISLKPTWEEEPSVFMLNAPRQLNCLPVSLRSLRCVEEMVSLKSQLKTYLFIIPMRLETAHSCIPVIMYSRIPVFPYSCILVFLYSCIPVFLHSCIPVFLYSCIPVLLHSYIPVLLYSCIPVFLNSCIPVFLYSCIPEIPVFPYSCIPVIPVFHYSIIPLFLEYNDWRLEPCCAHVQALVPYSSKESHLRSCSLFLSV